jgi:hypothetical protein
MIYVYSSPRGSGKTTRAIELLNKNVANFIPSLKHKTKNF